MNENKVKIWLARDKDGSIFIHNNKPKKDATDIIWMSDYFVKLNKEEFSSVKWEDDEPTEAYITLANEPKEQPKKEIDWEQRRYEIAKDLYVRYSATDEKEAIRFADKFIEELKKRVNETDNRN